jgi:hypothetical protein
MMPPGWMLQLRLLDILDELSARPIPTSLFVCRVFGHDFERLGERGSWPDYRAEFLSVSRALHALAEAGRIRSLGRCGGKQSCWGRIDWYDCSGNPVIPNRAHGHRRVSAQRNSSAKQLSDDS